MSQLPNQLCTLDSTRGLPVSKPLYHSLSMQGGRCRARIVLAGRLDEEMSPSRKGVVCRGWIIATDKSRLDKSRLDAEDICLVEHGLDEAFNRVLAGAVWPEPRNSQCSRCRAEY